MRSGIGILPTRENLKDARSLEVAVRVALAQPDRGARNRAFLAKRAVELDALDSVPPQWLPEHLRPAKKRAEVTRALSTDAPAPTRDLAPSVDLDAPLEDLMSVDRREMLDATVRVLARELDVGYADAMTQLQDGLMGARGLMGASTTVGAILTRAGVKELDHFQAEVRMLQSVDLEVTKTLDAALEPVAAQRLDGQGRVRLDADFDVPAYLHSDESRERRWRRARELQPAYGDRASFDYDDLLHLEGGVDLVKTLERPRVIAGAQEQARNTQIQLERAIEATHEPRQRLKQLDQAIGTLQAARASVKPPADPFTAAVDPEPALRVLDQGEPLTLSALPVSQMTWVLDQAVHKRTMTLDAAIATAATGNPIPAAAPDHKGIESPRSELHEAVLAHQAAHPGTDYMTALNALTGFSPDR